MPNLWQWTCPSLDIMSTFIPFPYFALVSLYRALTLSEKSLPSWYDTSYYSVLSHLLPTITNTVLIITYSYFQVHCLVILLPICSLLRMISYSIYRIHIKLSMILFVRVFNTSVVYRSYWLILLLTCCVPYLEFQVLSFYVLGFWYECCT